jgi:hypothetical protein
MTNTFPGAAATAGLAILLALNAVNPEAFVVRRDKGRPDLDTAYIDSLSPDAAPAIADAGLAPHCAPARQKGWAAFNFSLGRAIEVGKRAGVCQP